MNVAELKRWLADKKGDAIVEVIAHNRSVNFSLSLGGGSDCRDDYDSVDFYVDELCQSEKVQVREALGLQTGCPKCGGGLEYYFHWFWGYIFGSCLKCKKCGKKWTDDLGPR